MGVAWANGQVAVTKREEDNRGLDIDSTVVASRGKSVGRYVPRPVAQLQVAVAESVVQ